MKKGKPVYWITIILINIGTNMENRHVKTKNTINKALVSCLITWTYRETLQWRDKIFIPSYDFILLLQILLKVLIFYILVLLTHKNNTVLVHNFTAFCNYNNGLKLNMFLINLSWIDFWILRICNLFDWSQFSLVWKNKVILYNK